MAGVMQEDAHTPQTPSASDKQSFQEETSALFSCFTAFEAKVPKAGFGSTSHLHCTL